MPRRVSLPAADDLFRSGPSRDPVSRDSASRDSGAPARAMAAVPTPAPTPAPADHEGDDGADESPRKSSGRVRHDEKMTVYVTADELLEIEHARLSLRRDQGLAVDRGRLVREAIAIVLADLELNGDDSVLVQRLIGR